MTRPFILGLTGSIGMGKSTVAEMFREAGVPVFDADIEVHKLQGPGGPLLPAIEAAFPGTTGPAGVDRVALGGLVFGDPAALARLEAIVHPAVGKVRDLFLLEHAGMPLVVFDVPLLAESPHWRGRVERVLVVDCLEATQLERVMRRSGWTREVVLRVIAQQATRAARRAIADAVLFNEGLSLTQLDALVEVLWAGWAGDRVKQ